MNGGCAWWSGTVATFLATPPAAIRDRLAASALQHFRVDEAAQLRAWDATLALLAAALSSFPEPTRSRLLLEWPVPRLGGRLDAALVSPAAVFAIEFKIGADWFDSAARGQVEGYALDLQDFHAGSRFHPVIPVLVASDAASAPPSSMPMLFAGASDVQCATAICLGALLNRLATAAAAVLRRPIDVDEWERARYAPVPGIIDAACHLFARHDVSAIASARADAANLTSTADAIDRALASAAAGGDKIVVFVTGIPGAGKTLCGLNAAFARGTAPGAPPRAFLTGNPTLVHVLREALVRDAVDRGQARAAATQRAEGVIQALTRFRDDGVASGQPPPERVVVIDEAQRSWTTAQAIGKSRDRAVRLDRSEPAHLLDIMARHDGFAALVCLVGGGQEIHDGEGGLRCWGEALGERPRWRVAHAPDCLTNPEPRARLPHLAGAVIDGALHLTVPIRAIRHDATPAWVDAVLRSDAERARLIADGSGDLPFRLVRSLSELRATLRHDARDLHRAGLLASSGARRLRAEGLGAELPHMEATAVAHWFLNHWHRARDVRSSGALEVVATEFSVQGLELDHVGLCWGGDLVRPPGGSGPWVPRRFAGTRWQVMRDDDKVAWRLNAYRVLLTRARYRTTIWVPRGDRDDPSRDPATLDAIANFLGACGARPAAHAAAPTASAGRADALPPLFAAAEPQEQEEDDQLCAS